MKCQQHLKAQIYFCLRTPICQSGQWLPATSIPLSLSIGLTWKDNRGCKSALNLILPEVYLEDDNVDERIADIHKNMDSYISEGVFEEYKDAMIYVERTQSDGKVRAGIVGAIDLEEYDYRKGSKSAVRATEATVVERIPPRIKVRRGAPVELPHIMILVDDTEKALLSRLKPTREK